MSERLIDIIRSGGSAEQIDATQWAIRRGRDRRGRIVGCLDAADIDPLRAENALKPLGSELNSVWIWSSAPPVRARQHVDISGVETALTTLSRDTIFLAQVILLFPPLSRSDVIASVIAFQHDFCVIHMPHKQARMNWQALKYGTRVTGGIARQEPKMTIHVADARRRLGGVRRALSISDWQLLQRLCVHDWSQARFVRETGVAVAKLNQSARRVMIMLLDAYQCVGEDR